MRVRELNVNIKIGHLVGEKHYVEVKVKVTPDQGEAYTVMKPELLKRHDFESRVELLVKRAAAQVREILGAEADLGRPL